MFPSVLAHQTTIKVDTKSYQSLWVKEIGRCMGADGLSFNILNSPYWQKVIIEFSNYVGGVKQTST